VSSLPSRSRSVVAVCLIRRKFVEQSLACIVGRATRRCLILRYDVSTRSFPRRGFLGFLGHKVAANALRVDVDFFARVSFLREA
jgi:hypothetical protein